MGSDSLFCPSYIFVFLPHYIQLSLIKTHLGKLFNILIPMFMILLEILAFPGSSPSLFSVYHKTLLKARLLSTKI